MSYTIDACLSTNANGLCKWNPLVASVRGKSITEHHLDGSIRSPDATMQKPMTQEKPARGLSSSRSLPVAVESLERRMIEDALRESGGNRQKAAQPLGLSRQGNASSVLLTGSRLP